MPLPPAFDHRPVPGHLVGPYRIERYLGGGGQGSVWLVRAPDDTPLALKLLHPHADVDTIARFHREARLGRELAHPSLVAVRDVLREPVLGIVFEYVDGPSLAGLLSVRPRLPRSQLASLVQGLAAGLGALHAGGVVHRDVKPSNVLLSVRDGQLEPRLADFGIAKAGDGTSLTRAAAMGSRPYMAPEQHVDAASATPAMDVFALACVVHEAAGGSRTFPQSSEMAAYFAKSEGRWAPLDEQRSDLPPEWTGAIAAALAVSAADRPALPEFAAAFASEPAGRIAWTPADAEALAARDAAARIDAHVATERLAGTLSAGEARHVELCPQCRVERRLLLRALALYALVGRDDALEEAAEALGSGARLLSLKGPPGVGKSVLAAAIADDWAEQRGVAVELTDLAQVPDGADIVAVLEEASGRGGVWRIDNADRHLELVRARVRRWLDQRPERACIVTARERLHVAGDVCLSVEPLAPPHARELFERLATEHRPLDELRRRDAEVERILQHLEGVPLSIELVAAALRGMSLPDAARRLDTILASDRLRPRDAPANQRSLAATFAWSWSLLTEPERAALAQVTVFRGGFTLAAAEAVVATPGRDAVSDVLLDLTDRSLLGHDGERYRLLEALRARAAQHLDPPLRRAAEERHARYFLEVDAFEDLPNRILATRWALGNLSEDLAVVAAQRLGDLLVRWAAGAAG